MGIWQWIQDQALGMPALRGLAKELAGTPEAAAFLAALPHDFYDENNLHALLLMRTRGFAPTLAGVEAFLPEVDNWATCDLLRPRAFAAGGGELLAHIRGWLASPRCYTVRFGIGLLLSNYLGGGFCPQQAAWVADCCGEEYYVNMKNPPVFSVPLPHQKGRWRFSYDRPAAAEMQGRAAAAGRACSLGALRRPSAAPPVVRPFIFKKQPLV